MLRMMRPPPLSSGGLYFLLLGRFVFLYLKILGLVEGEESESCPEK